VQRKFAWGGPDAGGWLMLMELDGSDNLVRKYTWGLDLAGRHGSGNSLESAGGIGGLLAVAQAQVGGGSAAGGVDAGEYVFTYDANGNVVQVLDLSAGSAAAAVVAHYEYDPYGGVVNDLSGYTYAEANPIRFSTKYHDAETGLGYWGYRYYSARLGRWLSRDPLGEDGGLNVYAYADDPLSGFDPLGLQATTQPRGRLGVGAAPASLSQQTCGLGWVPVPGDDGKTGIDEVSYTPWQAVGDNRMVDQMFRFRHLIKHARLKYDWVKRVDAVEVSACGRNLSSSVTLHFGELKTWQVGASMSVSLYKHAKLGVSAVVGGATQGGHSVTLHFIEGAPCYEYKGYVFARRVSEQTGFLRPWRSPYSQRMEYFSEKGGIGWTGEYKKLLCRRPCCSPRF